MNIDDWLGQIWPWLRSIASHAGADAADLPSADNGKQVLHLIGPKARALGGETCAHLLTQGWWFYNALGILSDQIAEIQAFADGIDSGISTETADVVAAFLINTEDDIRRTSSISLIVRDLLERLPDTPTVSLAREKYPVVSSRPHDAYDVAGSELATATTAPERLERGAGQREALTEADLSSFWDAVYPQLFLPNDKPRPLGWALLNRGLKRAIRQRAAQAVAPTLLESLAEKAALAGTLPRSEHALVPACVAVIQSPAANAVAEAIGVVVRQAAPTSQQVTSLCTVAGRYDTIIRQLLLRAITGILDSAAARKDRLRAASCVETCATLAEYVTQMDAKSLWDRLEVFNLESSLALDELRQRADSANRPDLAILTMNDRTALLNAAQSFQAQVAIAVCKKYRQQLLEQAKTWLAQQLGDTVSSYRAPTVPHPATVRPGRYRLTKRDVDDAKNGNQPAVARCRQALEPFITRGRNIGTEEWDAYLDAQARRLPDAADKWRRMASPSPEVCWNLAIFDTGRRFAETGAYKHIDQGLRSWRADTDMVLLGLWLALQALEDEQSSADVTAFFSKWACEVPDPRVLLAALAVADADSPRGFARAEASLRQWGQLADPIPLRARASTSPASIVDEVRRESRYTQLWQRCMLASAASSLAPGAKQTVLVALAELAEKDPDHATASETWSRVVEEARDRLDFLKEDGAQLQRRIDKLPEGDSRIRELQRRQQSNKRSFDDAVYGFRPVGSGALRFAVKWRDERLARAVKAIIDKHSIPTSAEQDKLLRNLLPERAPAPPREVRPEIAELLPKLTAATDPASVSALARSVEPALVYVGASQRVRELAHQIFSDFKRLSDGVEQIEAESLLDQIGRSAEELQSYDASEESVAALLSAVRRASQYAADNLLTAPPPSAVVPEYWAGLSRETEIPQAVIGVRGAQQVELHGVSVSAGMGAVPVGDLAPDALRTMAIPAKIDWPTHQDHASIAVELEWSWGYVSGRRHELDLTAPVTSWDALLADAGVGGLEIPDEFVVNEPLNQSQVVSGLFQGRDEHLDYILRNYLDRLPATPAYFHGIRKVGKSSLLNRVVVDLMRAGRRVDLVTAQGLQPMHQSLASTVANLCRRIGKVANLDLLDIPAIPENPIMFFDDYLESYAQRATSSSGSPPVLVIDEFHCLYTQQCAPLLDVIRLAAEERRCGFIFAGVEGPTGLPQNTGLLVEPRRVDFLSQSDLKNLLRAVLGSRPILIPQDVENLLFDEAAGHPNFTSALIKGALRRANASRRNVICANDVWGSSDEIAANQQHMFDISWFDPSILSDSERAIAVDLTHTMGKHRGWLNVPEVLRRMNTDVRPALRTLENSYVIESRSVDGGLQIRIRGGVLERYLRMLHGARLEKSPDPSRQTVGLFIDLENIVGAASSPDLLADQLLAFANRLGSTVPPVAVATSYSLSLAGWDSRVTEAAFVARGIRFEMPAAAIESKENAADMTLQPIIMQTAEQYNLAEVVIVSADHYFLPTANRLLQGVEGASRVASGRRVHVIGGYSASSKAGKIGPPWHSLVEERSTTCQILGLEGPDLVIWDADEVLADPKLCRPATVERFRTVMEETGQ